MKPRQVVLDYETRSRVSIKQSSGIEYAKHESTSIFCLGYRIDDGPLRLWIPERTKIPADLLDAFHCATLVAHNAAFERAITRWTLPRYPLLTDEQRELFRSLPPSRWKCTAAKTAACSLPRKLEDVASVLSLPTQKDKKGHKLILKYCKPRKPSKKNPKTWWDDKKDLRAIYRYCLVDVQAEYELDQALPDLTPEEQAVWELDQKINDRGVRIDVPTVKLILSMVNEEMANIAKQVTAMTKGGVTSVSQQARVLSWLNERGADLPNLKAPTLRDKLLKDDVTPEVKRMIEYRQSGSRTSTAKYIAMLKAVGADDRARELLLYGGAMPTMRWAGKRVQPQNFPRPTIKGFSSDEAIATIQSGGIKAIRAKYGDTKVMDVLVSSIRGMLIPSEEREFYCADFAAVEARIAFWLAEHQEGIQAFIEDRKLYEEMASDIFKMDLEDVKKDSLERFVGKESILGCQYGLGWAKFLKNCHQKGMPSVTAQIAKKAVYTYRDVHAPVPAFWRNIENAVVQAIRNPGETYQVTKVKVYKRGRFLNIELPSGRRLRYFKPRLSQKQLANGRMVPQIHYWTVDHHQWCEVVTWGGIFTNHCVQGIARDLMVAGIFNIEEAGYQFLLSVHDEGLAEKKIGSGNLKEYVALMAGKLPRWAKGAPITAEGWVGPRYKK